MAILISPHDFWTIPNSNAGITKRMIYSNFQPRKLTNYEHTQNAPLIHGGYMSWLDTRLHDREGKIMPRIYMMDLVRGEEKATPNYAKKSGARAQYRNRLVWAENTDRLRVDNYDIKIFDFKKGTTDYVCKEKNKQDNPQISENFVIWRDWRDVPKGNENSMSFAIYGLPSEGGEEFLVKQFDTPGTGELFGNFVAMTVKNPRGDWDVQLFNCSNKKIIPVCNDFGDQITPKIVRDVVVWLDNRNSQETPDSRQTDVYGYNIATKKTLTISTNLNREYGLVIGADRYVFWYENTEPNFAGVIRPIIKGYDVLTSKMITVATEPGNYRNVCADGQYVIYEVVTGSDRFGSDIMAYNLNTGQTYCVAKGIGDQRNPRIYGDFVAWEDQLSQDDEEVSIWGTCLSFPLESPEQVFYGYQEKKVWTMFRGDQKHNGTSTMDIKPIDKFPFILQWQVELKEAVYSTPCFSKNGYAYVGCDDGSMYKIAVSDGSLIWKFKTSGKIRSSPAIYMERLFFGDQNGKFYCLDTNTGQVIWEYQTAGPIDGSPTVFQSDTDHYGCVVIGSGDRKLYMFNALSLTPMIKWTIDLGGWSYGAPTVDYNQFVRYSDQEPVQKVLYVGVSNNRILCVQCSTGQILSEFKTESSIEATPVCDGATVMAGAKDGNFYGLHFFAWGQKPYVFFKQSTEHQLTSSAILDQAGCRVIYEGKSGWIYSFKNSLQWSLKIDESMRSSPILINCSQLPVIFAGSDSGMFFMIDAKTGKPLWSEKLTGSVVASPSVYDNGFVCVLVATTDHRLSCFGQRPKYPDDW